MIRFLRLTFFGLLLLINLKGKAQQYPLGNDTTLCAGQTIVLNPFTNAIIFPDSLVIIYDATKGQTQLVGASKVYFHSGYQVIPFGSIVGWVGNWGQDDGLGQMQSLGNNLWRIAINLESYYSLLPGTNLNALAMVFRNESGTLTGKDDTGNDIYLVLNPLPPSSTFNGIAGHIKRDNIASILWSTGATSPSITVNSGGNYSFITTDTLGVSFSDDIVINYSNTQLNLGNDIALCGTTNAVLSAGAGFNSYLWNTGATTQTLTVTNTGVYFVTVQAGNCTLSDTIDVSVSAINFPPINLGTDTSVCGGAVITLNSNVSVTPYGDSLTIIYDATQGQTQLIGATKVYMHSGYQEQPFGAIAGWIGNWGMDDGLGQMTQIGTNRWKITIKIADYYNISPSLNINALVMVFRNEDGTLTGKDGSGNDIYLVLAPTPNSSFGGISVAYYSSVLWSTSENTPSISVSNSGAYSVQVTTNTGCILTDTIQVNFGAIPFVNAGNSQNICAGQSVILDAGGGFVTYSWASGETTSAITVSQPGTYTITVTNNDGCVGIDVINIGILPEPVASFTYSDGSFVGYINFTNTSTNATSYAWDFNNDGNTDNTTANPFYVYSGPGSYTVKLIVNNDCGSDTISIPVIVATGISNRSTISAIKVFPNPFENNIYLKFDQVISSDSQINLFNMEGQIILSQKIINQGNNFSSINTPSLSSGFYTLQIINNNTISNFKIIKN